MENKIIFLILFLFTLTLIFAQNQIYLTAEVITYNDVYLSWVDSLETNDITGFEIYRDSVLISAISNPAISDYFDYALDSNLYSYYVVALFDSLDSVISNVEYINVTLPAPMNLTYTYNPIPPNLILQWDSPPFTRDLNIYNIYRDDEIIGQATSTFYLDEYVPGWLRYYVTAVYDGGYESGPSNQIYNPIDVDDYEFAELRTELIGNYPNPFNPSGVGRSPTTTISFSIFEKSNVELSIYNIKGQRIRSLANNVFIKGNHSVIWDGNDDTGNLVNSGLYFYKLNVNGKTESVKKCLLLK